MISNYLGNWYSQLCGLVYHAKWFVTSIFLLLTIMSPAVCKCKGKKCNVSVILENYKAVIFDELKNLKNMTGLSENKENMKQPKIFSCQSKKDQRILQPIYCMTLFLKSQVNCTTSNDIDSAICKITEQMEVVIKCHCKRMHQLKEKKCTSRQSNKRKRGKKHREKAHMKANAHRLKIISNLDLCWEKLYFNHR